MRLPRLMTVSGWSSHPCRPTAPPRHPEDCQQGFEGSEDLHYTYNDAGEICNAESLNTSVRGVTGGRSHSVLQSLTPTVLDLRN